ncbi:MAG: glycoside hydrolase family 92 protein [Bacteroidetes bacterium]|nr:glycoside hydrolase family 92 protein [Bacteroidota bacterium]
MKKINLSFCKVLWVVLSMFLFQLNVVAQEKKKSLADYVDPFIGVLDPESNCVIGPQLPNGSINPSPQTPKGSHDGYSPKEEIRGFGQLHVSGTGWGKYGQVFVSPQIGLAIGETDHDSPKEEEKATAYAYTVKLSRYNIRTEVTPSFHSAIYRFTFPKSDRATVIFDLSHHIAKDIAPELGGNIWDGSLSFTRSSNDEIKGYGNYSGGFGGAKYRVYFCARVSKAPTATGTWLNGVINSGKTSEKLRKENDRIGAYFQFNTSADEEICMKVAVSFRSIEQATTWLDAEIPDFNYDKVCDIAKQQWNEQLNKIVVEGGTERDKKIFYTAFYHASIMPRDRTNDSEHFESGVSVWDDHFAVWDTWRTLYPLQVLINPKMVSSTVNSFIARLKINHMVKDAYVAGTEMIEEQGGNNIDNIIADAYVKGIQGVDWKEAYKVLKFNADNERQGSYGWDKKDSTNTYKTLGWIPSGRMSNSMTLEYAYNDFCAAQVAKDLGTKEDYKKYLDRSGQWVKLWDANAESDGFKGFIMPRKMDGSFVKIDAKRYPGSWNDHFYEGSSWTYSYFMPHQFEKLVQLSGGKRLFAEKLQHGFENKLIDYGNEPAFLAVQAFHYADRSDLASYYVRKLMKERFNEEGYSGNDDSGAMSSWFMFSAMGFFPNAGQNIYYLTGSSFTKVTLTLGNQKTVTISAPEASPTNIYVKSVTINGKKWNKPWFSHKDIQNGAKIVFEMSDKPLISLN